MTEKLWCRECAPYFRGGNGVISDEGKQSNPRRHQIRALQAGLDSLTSACHDYGNILLAIGQLKVITFNGNHAVDLADVKLRLMAPNPLNRLDPEVDVILQRFWGHLETISNSTSRMRLLVVTQSQA